MAPGLGSRAPASHAWVKDTVLIDERVPLGGQDEELGNHGRLGVSCGAAETKPRVEGLPRPAAPEQKALQRLAL